MYIYNYICILKKKLGVSFKKIKTRCIIIKKKNMISIDFLSVLVCLFPVFLSRHGAPYLPGAPSSAETTRQFLPRGSAGNHGNFLEKRMVSMQN
jgi:hypothetical protein